MASTAHEAVGVGEIGFAGVDLGGVAGAKVEAPELADVALCDNEGFAVPGHDDATKVEPVFLGDRSACIGPCRDRPFSLLFGDSEDLGSVGVGEVGGTVWTDGHVVDECVRLVDSECGQERAVFVVDPQVRSIGPDSVWPAGDVDAVAPVGGDAPSGESSVGAFWHPLLGFSSQDIASVDLSTGDFAHVEGPLVAVDADPFEL